jgi:hypothetical protein
MVCSVIKHKTSLPFFSLIINGFQMIRLCVSKSAVLNDEHKRTAVVSIPQFPFWGLNLRIADSDNHCLEVFVVILANQPTNKENISTELSSS